jgi:hypothetical protein
MTFEQRLFSGKADAPERFEAAARAIFSTEEGKVVLAMLCGAAHPLKHSEGMTEHEHGHSEVVATLWRFGSSNTAIPNS